MLNLDLVIYFVFFKVITYVCMYVCMYMYIQIYRYINIISWIVWASGNEELSQQRHVSFSPCIEPQEEQAYVLFIHTHTHTHTHTHINLTFHGAPRRTSIRFAINLRVQHILQVRGRGGTRGGPTPSIFNFPFSTGFLTPATEKSHSNRRTHLNPKP